MELIGINVAIIVVTISILLSGIIIGAGRALSYRNVERFGIEELTNSIINAGIVGSAAAIVEVIKTISSNLVSKICGDGDAITQLSCSVNGVSTGLFTLLNELTKTSVIVGYYQSMQLNFGSFSIQPFTNLGGISNALSSQVVLVNILIILNSLNAQLLGFFAQNGLGLFLPIGLIFRSFFATRRLGGFLIGIGIGFYIFYPLFALSFPLPELETATTTLENFNKNPDYAVLPIMDLNGNYAIAQKLDSMSFKKLSNLTSNSTDFSGDLSYLVQAVGIALSKVLLYSFIASIVAIIITIVFIKEMSQILGGEFGFSLEVI